jgi:hypothetical protein
LIGAMSGSDSCSADLRRRCRPSAAARVAGWGAVAVILHTVIPGIAQPMFPTAPQRVWLTGTLVAFDPAAGVGFHALILVVNERQWLYRLTDLRTQSSRPQPDWTLLTYLFPPRVRVQAADAAMRFLAAPERDGDRVRIDAYLYISNQSLDVIHLKLLELGAAAHSGGCGPPVAGESQVARWAMSAAGPTQFARHGLS